MKNTNNGLNPIIATLIVTLPIAVLLGACSGSGSDPIAGNEMTDTADGNTEMTPETGSSNTPSTGDDGGDTTNTNPDSSDTVNNEIETGGIEPYVGFYQESAANNPEDPVGGFIYLLLPTGDGVVDGEFLFSYQGCDGNLDTGRISGNKANNSFSGSWTGNVDLVQIGGNFDGSTSASGSGFQGSYQNDAGKVEIDLNDCGYFVAANGVFTVFPVGDGTDQITVDTSNGVRFDWNAQSGLDYLLSVYDEQCLRNQSSIDTCTNWYTLTSESGVSFGQGGVLLNPLATGKDYLASLTSTPGGQAGVGSVDGFASARFTAP